MRTLVEEIIADEVNARGPEFTDEKALLNAIRRWAKALGCSYLRAEEIVIEWTRRI